MPDCNRCDFGHHWGNMDHAQYVVVNDEQRLFCKSCLEREVKDKGWEIRPPPIDNWCFSCTIIGEQGQENFEGTLHELEKHVSSAAFGAAPVLLEYRTDELRQWPVTHARLAGAVPAVSDAHMTEIKNRLRPSITLVGDFKTVVKNLAELQAPQSRVLDAREVIVCILFVGMTRVTMPSPKHQRLCSSISQANRSTAIAAIRAALECPKLWGGEAHEPRAVRLLSAEGFDEDEAYKD